MDPFQVFYLLAQLYVRLLGLVGIGTVGILVFPRVAPSPQLAGVWFAVGGFGALVLVTVIMVTLLQ
jgi:hypothetical protein